MAAPVPMETMVPRLRDAFRSERLVFRRLENNDETKAFWYNDLNWDDVGDGLSNPQVYKPQTKTGADEMIKSMSESLLAVMICLKPSADADKDAKPTMIGYLDLSNRGPWVRSAAIGLRIAEAYQNKGYGREAINWALDWAFRWGEMHRVSIGTITFNERAVALYRSIGFVDESRIREVVFFDLRWHDMLGFSMLENEWRAIRGIA